MLYRKRRLAVTVFQFGFHVDQLPLGLNSRNSFVHTQTLVFFRNIFRRNANIESEIKLCLRLRLGFALHLAHSLLQHLCIEIKPDGFNVPALLTAEQIASSAQFKIKRCNFKTGAQI